MRILWFVAGVPKTVSEKLGAPHGNGGGWIDSMLDSIQRVDAGNRFMVLCQDTRHCDETIGNVRYVSFGSGCSYTPAAVPETLQSKIKSMIAEFNPDIIHVQGTEYFYGCMDTAVYCGKPVVVSIQGVLSEYWWHLTGGIPVSDVRRHEWVNLRACLRGRTIAREQKIWRYQRARQEQQVFRQQHYFIGRTEWDRHCLAFYNPTAQYFHVNESLRAPFYVCQRNRAKVRRHSIYCAGAASYPLKGAHFLLYALSELKDEFPDIQLRIAGADRIFRGPATIKEWIHEQAYYQYLRQLAKKLRVREHVVALPGLDAESVAEELCNAELYVSAALCENSPNSLGEAMLVGTPAVQTFVGGVPSILKDGVEGKLVPPSDPHALAGAIRDRFNHPELGEAMVEAARATALARHDVVRNAKDTLDVYRAIVGMES